MTDDRDLDDAIRELPRSLDPPADLWPEIAARIDTRARTRRRAVTVGVIAAAAAVALFVAIDRGRDRAHDLDARWAAAIEPTTAPAVAPSPIVPTPAPAPDLIPGEAQLRLAANELTGAYDRRRPLLDRELLAVYEENLGIVDAAIDRSRAALVVRPDDAHLQRVLDRAYHHKLSLLRRASSGEAKP